MRRYSKEGSLHLFCYDSQSDFIACALADLPPAKNEAATAWNSNQRQQTLDRAATGHRGALWYGLDFAELDAAICDGWREGADNILAEMQGIGEIAAPVSVKRRRNRGDFGDSIDMQAVYRGAIDTAWTRCTKRSTRAPRPVTLVASMQGTSDIQQHVFYARGAALLKCADLLTEAGYAVEVVADYTVRKPFERSPDGEKLTHRFPLKEAGQPLDLPRLAAAVALAGFKRHYGFLASGAAANSINRRVDDGYGYSINASRINESDVIGFEDAKDISSARRVAEAIIKAIDADNADPE